jgi:hypothetical protein
MRSVVFGLCLAALALPATAQALPGTVATRDTPEWLVGDAVLYFVGGRTREEAGGDDFNPFGMDADGILFNVGSFFVVTDFNGEAVREGDLAIYPQFVMPRGEGTPSAETPPIIPFALVQQGTCHGGYVAGFPVPDTIYTVDMAGAVCHAEAVLQMVYDAYQTAQTTDQPFTQEVPAPTTSIPGFDPAFPQDQDLQSVVYAAYDAVYALAIANPDYEFWDGSDFAPARDAIVSALASQGYAGVTVLQHPVAGPAEAKTCAAPGATELRVAFTPDRQGIAVAAASSRRVYAYEYDYAISPDLRILEPRDCATSGPGRAGTRSF